MAGPKDDKAEQLGDTGQADYGSAGEQAQAGAPSDDDAPAASDADDEPS